MVPDTSTRLFYTSRAARVIGIGLLFVSLLRYRSHANRTVFGIWSPAFAALVVIAAVLLITVFVCSWRGVLATRRSVRPVVAISPLLDLAVLAWGAASAIAAFDDPANGGRLTDLNFFGSSVPWVILLDWTAMVLCGVLAWIWLFRRVNKSRWPAVVVGGALLGTALVGEGYFRGRAVVAPITHGFPTHETYAWKARHVRLNAAGFRDIEHRREARSGIQRLLVVGDSIALGWGIPHIDQRFGERLARRLEDRSGTRWESINLSEIDTHTLDHLEFLERGLAYRPDVVILLYVFNDIDYLQPTTQRLKPTATWHPGTIAYRNSFLFQELFVQVRLVRHRFGDVAPADPYADTGLLAAHVADVKRFVERASRDAAVVAVVPFSVFTVFRFPLRYRSFTVAAAAAGVPVWEVPRSAFGDRALEELTVNRFDVHPNALAHDIAAEVVARRAANSAER